MSRNRSLPIFCLVLFLTFTCATPWTAYGQDNNNPYPSMAPPEQYLMDRDAEIALARTAAPDPIPRDAKILVLGRHGYETAVEGKNGFVCFVERAWMSKFTSKGFWNPKNRSPLCLNPEAARMTLPADYKLSEMALAGKSKEQMEEWFDAAYAKKELPDFEPGAMAYMMSKEAYLTDSTPHSLSHVMFYSPVMEGANWGTNAPNTPVILLRKGTPEPYNIFIVPVSQWSDGTPAP